MNIENITALNARFGIAGELQVKEGPGGLALIEIANAHGSARILLQGAQLIDWTPAGQAPVIWLSRDARFVPGKGARGGVPVCWPWFGGHPDNADYPAHGFARSASWQLLETAPARNGGGTLVRLRLQPDDSHRAMWPHDSELELNISVAGSLAMELVTRNDADVAVTISEALHTYFAVGDIRRVAVKGLEGCAYLDKAPNGRDGVQQGPVNFDAETDRVYLDTTADCLIDDPVLARRIRVAKQGSASTVVWNPWIDKATRLGDMGEDGYLDMVCVESGNVAGNAVTLAPGAEHRLAVQYSVEALS